MYNYLASRVLAPALDIIRGTSMMRKYRELEETQWWPHEKIQELQNHRLQKLLKYAFDNVPYYRQIFDERNLTPDEINSPSDLSKLPVLTKKLVKENFNSLVSISYPGSQRVLLSTSGSTGEPVLFYDTREDHISISFAARQRARSEAGMDLGTKSVSLSVRYQLDSIKDKINRNIVMHFNRMMQLYSRQMFEEGMSKYAGKIHRFQPEILTGSPSSMHTLASYLVENQEFNIHPRAIFTGAEQLLEYDRDVFRKVFKCEAFDHYGAEEQHTIAFQCRRLSGYHIAAENVVVEIVDDDYKILQGGATGRVLITNLNNYAMPFIRYDLGDLAAFSEEACPCGRGLPMLSSISGRTSDSIYTRRRGRIPGLYLFYPAVTIFAEWGIKRYQIIQEDIDRIVVQLVMPENSDRDINELQHIIAEIFKRVVGEDTGVFLNKVTDIPVDLSQKRKFVVSLVNKNS